jgi:hypothetical protein
MPRIHLPSEFLPLVKRLHRIVITESNRTSPESLRRRTVALQYLEFLFEDLARISAIAALDALSIASLELLISVFGAERSGRPLTYDEKASRQIYAQVLSMKSAAFGIRASDWLEPGLDISLLDQAITQCLRHLLPDHVASIAVHAFREASDSIGISGVQFEAARRYCEQHSRLLGLAGFRDGDELQAKLAQWKESRAQRLKNVAASSRATS